MDITKAKTVLLEATEGTKRIERACDNKFVSANGKDYSEKVMVIALEELLREGEIIQIATPGQVRTAVSYRRSNESESKVFHKS